MLNLDPNSEFGARVQRRLRDEELAWLTTVDGSGTPRSVPVWFHWDGETVLIFSEPGQLKVRNIERNPRVSLHLQAAADGGDVITLTGDARIDTATPVLADYPDYLEKYRTGIKRIGLTPEQMLAQYSTVIRITPDRVSGH